MVSSPTYEVPSLGELPEHVAVIMDGNGRWASTRGKPRLEGHRRGAQVVRDITTFARELGLRYLTLFSFSVQNWRRPLEEVQGLMRLLEEFCHDERPTLMDNGIRLATIGDLSRLPAPTRAAVTALVRETEANADMTLTLALDYGGREEIAAAARRLAAAARAGEIDPEDIDEALFTTYLHDPKLPDPDLVVRTSGELRLSNFLLWQSAYAELYFTDVPWPDFTRAHFAAALRNHASRVRRFGATDAQLRGSKKAPPC